MYDVIVVGTGMGGATLGHALALAGKRVLFVEKGVVRRSASEGITGEYPEALAGFDAHRGARLREAGRSTDEMATGVRRVTPFIGSGGGGSSALYGMAMERFFAEDFAPLAQHDDPQSTLPQTWPLSHAQFAPWYTRAEALYHVRGTRDPLRPPADGEGLRAPPPLSPPNAQLASTLQSLGLHPYSLHLACDDVTGCATCQGVLCAKECKCDAATACLLPAVREHGAEVMDRTMVTGLLAERTRITAVAAERDGIPLTLHARHVVLAAGALMTPALLLHSKSALWPNGVANESDQVGRNVMRHALQFVLLRGAPRIAAGDRAKEIAFSDFYLAAAPSEGRKLGTVQSLGAMPSAAALLGRMPRAVRALARPLFGMVWQKRMQPLTVLATIMEDLPYAENRVLPAAHFNDGTRQRVRLRYRPSAYDLARNAAFRRVLTHALAPLRPYSVDLARDNTAIAHVCGSCRFGSDPATSVLDADNRAHGIDNLYVVDASFFPSSSGTNPALTIAANALRVAAHLRDRI